MSRPADRRGFLRGLVSLPLIGGGVTLIGAPSAVAEPVTEDLLHNYETWLLAEAHQLARECRPGSKYGGVTKLYTPAWDWHCDRTDLVRPSTRAALVLSTVGVDWRAEGRLYRRRSCA